MLLLLSLVCFQLGAAPTAADPVAVAYQDARKLPNAHFTRYLWLGPYRDKELAYLTLCSHCNRLSREPEIVLPLPITADKSLLRIDLRDYGWSLDTWEKLEDPYFRLKTQVVEKKKVKRTRQVLYTDGTYRPHEEEVEEEVKTTKLAMAPWWDALASKGLLELTQSNAPIVDGRWFFNQTAIQADRKVGYYDFLRVKNEADFDQLVGFDAKVLKTFPKESREVVATSTVTHQPRRIDRAGTVGGGYWRTSDVRIAKDNKNPLRLLDAGFEYDARESFGHLPNGMLAWGLFDAKGVRQDAAPDFIASDSTAPGTDRRVHINLSCVRCHASGIQDIRGWARSVLAPPNALQSPDYEELRKLRRLYFTRLERYIEADRAVYADAVFQTVKVSLAKDAGNYAKFWADYENAAVTRQWAAAELGVQEGVLVNALRHQLATVGSLDPLLANWLGPNLPITIRQWEELYHTVQTIIRGGVPK